MNVVRLARRFVGLLAVVAFLAALARDDTNGKARADTNLQTLQAPGAGPVQVDVLPDRRVRVTSRYWRLEFDLRHGGVLDTVVFLHGSGRNLLTEPFHTYVDGWSDQNTSTVQFRSTRQGDVVQLVFSGRLADGNGRQAPVAFRTVWTLSGFVVRVDHELRFLEETPVRVVGVGSTAVRGELNEYGVRVGPAEDSSRRKMAPARFGKVQGSDGVLYSLRHAPLYLLFFDRGTEGFDLTTASDLATWESGLTGQTGVGRYEARVADDGRVIRLWREPLRVAQPVTVSQGRYTFSYWLGLPRIVERAARKWRHLSFGNHPWPSDQRIAEWAASGVNIVRLHNDYAEDENFWHDGAWPPYDEHGMAELRRVIATCHRYRIRVVPYFSIHEFHPKAQGYREHEQEWKRSTDAAGTVFHNYHGKGEFGAQMCPQSGWLERRKRDIEQAYRELGMDGIYFDWVMSLPCNNKHHNPRWHVGADGVVELLAWTRRLIAPNGTLILHIYGKMPSIAFENFADLVVNMEELSSSPKMLRMSDVPLVTVLAESIPRSPCPSYRRDRTRERNQNNIAHHVVLGMFPWSGGTGGPVYEETLKLFRTFKPYRLENYRFHSALTGAVQTSRDDVFGAVYGSSTDALVVLSNTSAERRDDVSWTVRPEALEFDVGGWLELKDTKTSQSQKVRRATLTSGTLRVELGPYEYRLFEVRPAK